MEVVKWLIGVFVVLPLFTGGAGLTLMGVVEMELLVTLVGVVSFGASMLLLKWMGAFD